MADISAIIGTASGGGGAVASVFGRVGAVVAVPGDYDVSQVTNAASIALVAASLATAEAYTDASVAPLAPLASPALTGVPTAPTAAPATNTTQLATTAFVTAAIAAIPAAPVSSVFGRVGAVVAVPGDYSVAQVTGAAPLASPALTGIPTAPTAAAGTNTTQIATTAFVTAAVAATNAIRTATASTNLTATDETVLLDASLGDVVLTLPAVATAGAAIFNAKRIDGTAHLVNVTPQVGEFIDQVATYSLSVRNQSVQFQSDGTAWYVL